MVDKSGGASPVELDPPAEALEAKSAVEVLRAWIADGRMHVTFHSDTFAHDVAEWGRLLADISHHLARGVALGGQLSEREALAAIFEAYERGVSGGSTVTTGRLQGRTKH